MTYVSRRRKCTLVYMAYILERIFSAIIPCPSCITLADRRLFWGKPCVLCDLFEEAKAILIIKVNVRGLSLESQSVAEVGIYKRKISRKRRKHAFDQEKNKIKEMRKKTCVRPRKKVRKDANDHEK